jgi:hypothetical protein
MPHQLFEDHRKIVAAADELLAFLRQNPAFRIEALSPMRARLGILSLTHLRAEEEVIMGPLFASGGLDALPGAKATIAAGREARTRYSDHIRAWTPRAIERDRTGYVAAVADIVAMVKEVIAQEEADLYWPALRLLTPEARAGNG